MRRLHNHPSLLRPCACGSCAAGTSCAERMRAFLPRNVVAAAVIAATISGFTGTIFRLLSCFGTVPRRRLDFLSPFRFRPVQLRHARLQRLQRHGHRADTSLRFPLPLGYGVPQQSRQSGVNRCAACSHQHCRHRQIRPIQFHAPSPFTAESIRVSSAAAARACRAAIPAPAPHISASPLAQ